MISGKEEASTLTEEIRVGQTAVQQGKSGTANCFGAGHDAIGGADSLDYYRNDSSNNFRVTVCTIDVGEQPSLQRCK